MNAPLETLLLSLLRPVARLALRFQLRHRDVADLVKRAFLLEAERKIQRDGKKATDSALSLVTGLQRRDIGRLNSSDVTAEQRPNPLAQIVGHWVTSPDYASHVSLPKNGPRPSFESLVSDIRKDIHARTVLEALLDENAVSFAEDTQFVTRVVDAFVPRIGSEAAFTYLSASLSDHLSVGVSNVTAERTAQFERSVAFRDLSAEDAEALEAYASQRQQALLEDVLRYGAQIRTETPNTGPYRFRLGAFIYSGDDT